MNKSNIQLAIGVAISAVFLYFALRGVDPSKLKDALLTCNWLWTIPFTVVTFVSFYLRAWRWRYLMQDTAPGVTTHRLYSPMMIGFALNSIFPARLGEFARAFVLVQKDRLSFTSVFATIVVERIFDMIILLVLLAAVLKQVPLDPKIALNYGQYVLTGAKLQELAGGVLKLTLVALAGSALLLVPQGRRLAMWCSENIPYAPQGIRKKVTGILAGFILGLSALKSVKTVVIVVLQSLLIWGLIGWTLQLMIFGFPGMQMSFLQAVAIVVITCLAILIPAAPGYWGLYEVGVILGMLLLGIEKDQNKALAFALVVHSLQYFPVIAVGFYYLWKEKISIGELSQKRE